MILDQSAEDFRRAVERILKNTSNFTGGWHDQVSHGRVGGRTSTSGGQPIGGTLGIRDLASLDSAVAQPRMTVAGRDLYPTVVEKSAAIAFSRIRNHPYVDGNKRISRAAMDTFLLLNGQEVVVEVDG